MPDLPLSLAVCVAPFGPPDVGTLYAQFDAVVVVRDAAVGQQLLGRLHGAVPVAVPVPVPVAVPAEHGVAHVVAHVVGQVAHVDVAADVVVAAGLAVDAERQEVTWAGRPLPLTSRERSLLACLATSPARVWTYRQLYDAAWGGHYLGDPATVYSAVKRLRAKLRRAGAAVRVESVRGTGLVLREG